MKAQDINGRHFIIRTLKKRMLLELTPVARKRRDLNDILWRTK
jgi:hypothetical protein